MTAAVPDPWAFGWTQLFTLAGLIISVVVSVAGLRTFGKWKREKIEGLRIDIALEALSLAYESQGIFASIRNPGASSHEWEDMPRQVNESEESWNYRKTYYVPLKRINDNQQFFLNVLKLQPRFMAVFGPETNEIFKELAMARAHIIVSAQGLMRMREEAQGQGYSEERQKRRTRMEADIWEGMGDVYSNDELPGGDRVQRALDAFKQGIVKRCRPLVDQEFKSEATQGR